VQVASQALARLYQPGSLRNDEGGFCFVLSNGAPDTALLRLLAVAVDGHEVSSRSLELVWPDGSVRTAADIMPERPARLRHRDGVRLRIHGAPLTRGRHTIRVAGEIAGFGVVEIAATDVLDEPEAPPDARIPRAPDLAEDYAPDIIAERRAFVESFTGASLEHVARHSFDPTVTRGNVEQFLGVAQVPIGIAGPLRVNGEHAQGDFLIPLATSEGTLVASYNRGMKVLNLSGGVTATIAADCMQRAPVFVFDSARAARDFRDWVREHYADIQREAEATSHVAKLIEIEPYLASKFAYLRFNYATGDAAGQNMVGKATAAACRWIRAHAPGIRTFYLESNFGTDKKSSMVNVMRTRGKRVTAEATVPRRVLRDCLRVPPEALQYHAGVGNVGTLLSGANNNGLHAANAITAMFIATGQDVANVAEGAAGVIYSEITPTGDLYLSMTIPSLIVGTHGGGTGLPTQRECLEILGCVGTGKARKLAEIVAAVVLAGEISLAGAISASEWVDAHERMGRHR